MEVTPNKQRFQAAATCGGAGVALQTQRRITTEKALKAGNSKQNESTSHSRSTDCTPCLSLGGEENVCSDLI